jgi:hypothetical protein
MEFSNPTVVQMTNFPSQFDCISEMFEEGAVVGLDCLTPEWQENCNSAEVYLPELHWSCLYGEKVS